MACCISLYKECRTFRMTEQRDYIYMYYICYLINIFYLQAIIRRNKSFNISKGVYHIKRNIPMC